MHTPYPSPMTEASEPKLQQDKTPLVVKQRKEDKNRKNENEEKVGGVKQVEHLET